MDTLWNMCKAQFFYFMIHRKSYIGLTRWLSGWFFCKLGLTVLATAWVHAHEVQKGLFLQALHWWLFWAITKDFERNCCCIIYAFYYFFHTNALNHADCEKGISDGILLGCSHLLVYFLIIDVEITGNLSEHRVPKVLYQCLLQWGRFA